ncbi:MAG: T9SS type A sorting domain-containing protein [candidate division KSB1 bacterium]|nr:T9SS type A sorting domain-containing protein [candidate division KSB1 bacterium]
MMRTIWAVLFAWPFIALGSANLIVNPSFEDGATGWTLLNASIEPGDMIHGSYLCAIHAGGEGSVSQTAAVTVGKSYVALAWIKMGTWGEAGWLEVKYGEFDILFQEITPGQWHLYAVPFWARQDQVTITFRVASSTRGAFCDMFCLAEYEELLQDGSFEMGGSDLWKWNAWNWGANISDWEAHTGLYAMKAEASSGGGFGYYPDIFAPGEIIIAAAWIRTGENSLWYPGFRDHTGWTNLGWWAVRKEKHVTEINIEYSDVSWNQYVIPYKIPLNGFNPEILWWQQNGESESYCDDLMLFRSPYKDSEIPWKFIMNDPEGIWNIWPNPDDPTWPLTPAVSVEKMQDALPQCFVLRQNYPNPFNPETRIPFSLMRAGRVRLSVYNAKGALAARLVDSYLSAGEYEIKFHANSLPAGVYFYQLEGEGETQVKKMVLVE